MHRDIIHLNVSHFMVAVEEVLTPSLRNRPVFVAEERGSRAIVFDLSETAYRAGMRKGMFLRHAKKELRDAVVIPPRPELYRRVEVALYKAASRYSPTVEMQQRGHIFIDATGMKTVFGYPTDFAARIKSEIRDALSLDPVTTLAENKLVAKVASRVVKPDGFAAIAHGREAGFMSPQYISLLPGIGRKLEKLLTALGIETLGLLASISREDAETILGKKSGKLQLLARGVDSTPVISRALSKQGIEVETMLQEDSADREIIERELCHTASDAGMKLRLQNRSARRVKLKIEYSDSITNTLSKQFSKPIHMDRELFRTAMELFDKCMTRRVRVKRIVLSLLELSAEHMQLDLFTPPEILKEGQLQSALDRIRQRYGQGAVDYAFAVNRP